MIEIENTRGLEEYLDSDSKEIVRFPANTNLILANLGYNLSSENIAKNVDELEEIASKAGRCLHLRGNMCVGSAA